MALLGAAIGGGITYFAVKTATSTTKFVVLTWIASIMLQLLVMEQGESFEPIHLGTSMAIAALGMGVV